MAVSAIKGELVELLPYTPERCLEFFKEYVPDPSMTAESYVFNEAQVVKYHKRVSEDRASRIFAICREGRCIGEVALKDVDLGAGCGTLSIALCSEQCRGLGYGTEAEKLILGYAFGKLRLKTVFADVAKTNHRSKHVLEKLGFSFTHQAGAYLYYRLDRADFMAS